MKYTILIKCIGELNRKKLNLHMQKVNHSKSSHVKPKHVKPIFVQLCGEEEGMGMLSVWAGVWNSNFWKDTLNMAFGIHV